MIRFSRQHALHNIQSWLVSVATAFDESGFDSSLLHRSTNSFPASVDDDRMHPDRFHEVDVEQQVAQGVYVIDQAAADFYYSGLVTELPDPAESFDQCIGFLNCLFHSKGRLFEPLPESNWSFKNGATPRSLNLGKPAILEFTAIFGNLRKPIQPVYSVVDGLVELADDLAP